jgi:hypothetical protein
MRQPVQTPWYDDSLDAEMAASTLESRITTLANDQSDRIMGLFRYAAIFTNEDIYARMSDPSFPSMPQRIINRTKANLDTLVSRQIQDEVRAVFDTDDGDYEQHKMAEDMERFIGGETYRLKLREKFRMALRDAGWAGDGWLFWDAVAGKLWVERAHPVEMLMPTGSLGLMQGELYRQRWVPRQWALSRYPKMRDKLLEVATDTPQYYWPMTDEDMIRINYGWKLPSDDGSVPGRHVMSCGNVSLADREWTDNSFPFTRIMWDAGVIDSYSMGLVQHVLPLEMELDMVTRRIQASVRLFAVPRILQQAATKISPEYSNMLGNVYKYTGQAPVFDSGTPPPPGLFERERQLLDLIDAQCGVSAMELTGDVPSHTDSRPALREVQEIAAGRRAWLSKTCAEALAVNCSEQMIRIAREIKKDKGKYSAFGRAKDFVGSVDFPDLEDERFQIRVQDANLLPDTRAGKRMAVQDLAATNIFEPGELAQLIGGAPDIDAVLNRKNAAQKLVEKQIYSITKKHKYLAPDENQDVAYAKKYAMDEYMLLMTKDNVPQEAFDMLNQYTYDCDQILQMQEPPPAPPMPPQGPPGPMGGPPVPMQAPMPPGYAPAPGGPPVMPQ